ncbi:MAG: OmpA family protein [Gemmatimonadetes bacterium]|nr:OmpA family protein [Gemmatimonadota bacterium]
MELTPTSQKETEETWISISDMMAGLMVIFLFIAISYMLYVRSEKDKIEQIAHTYNQLQSALIDSLNNEFRYDFEKWNAELVDTTLSIQFRANRLNVLFGQGEAKLRPYFQNILSEFFPRYLEVLKQFKDEITEIRIEGHTSSEWITGVGPDKAYILNMELSQGRTRSVLEFVLQMPSIEQQDRNWIKGVLTANGLSSSQLLFVEGTEDREDRVKSRRVEFRVQTNAEKRIDIIVNQKQGS